MVSMRSGALELCANALGPVKEAKGVTSKPDASLIKFLRCLSLMLFISFGILVALPDVGGEVICIAGRLCGQSLIGRLYCLVIRNGFLLVKPVYYLWLKQLLLDDQF